MLINSMVKKLIGLPSNLLHDALAGLSEEDKEKLKILAQELLKAAAAGAVQGATKS